MRFWEIITEVEKKTKTKTKTTPFDFEDPTSKGELSTSRPKADVSTEIPGKTSSRQQSQNIGAELPQGAGDVMGQFMQNVGDVTDEIPNDEVGMPEPEEPVEPTTLPATISKALSADKTIDVNWHELRNLPGYAIEQIRGAFRPLFRSIIDAELEDIQVSTTLDPSMSKDQMKALIGHISNFGTKLDTFNLEAFGIDPEIYNVEKAYVYYLNGYNFLMMQENMMGQKNWYVYSGPAKSSPYVDNSNKKPPVLK